MKIEVIKWNDAVADAGWASGGSKPHRIMSMGKVVEETDKHVILASTFSMMPGDTQTNCRITIPTGMIYKRKTVKI